MNKFIISFAFLLGTNYAIAQSANKSLFSYPLPANVEHAYNITNDYAKTLSLSPEQKAEVYKTILSCYEHPMESEGSNVDIHAKIRAGIWISLSSKFSQLLDSKQLVAYKQIKHYPEFKEIRMKEKNGVLTWD